MTRNQKIQKNARPQGVNFSDTSVGMRTILEGLQHALQLNLRIAKKNLQHAHIAN